MKYRKKPVTVDAWQVGSSIEPPHWIHVALLNDDLMKHQNHGGDYFSMPHPSCEDGRLYAYRGDWIIRGVEGDLYPCSDSTFKKIYEEV